MKYLCIVLFLFSTLSIFSQVYTEQVDFTYNIAGCVGTSNSTAWIGESVVLMIEGEVPEDRDKDVMTTMVTTFELIINKFEEVTELDNLPIASSYENKPVIEIVLDNCGAGGLASHGVLGMSTGKVFFDRMYDRYISHQEIAVPQVFYYELNRNFWDGYNSKFDWSMDNNPANYGWWTVGMNNAMAYMMPHMLDIKVQYFGSYGLDFWADNMLNNFSIYRNDIQYDFNFGWTQSLMPWQPDQSINDLMSGFIIYSYQNFGGEDWLKRFYKQMNGTYIEDRSEMFAFQECRDNIYKIWSIAAGQDLCSFFENDMKWVISPIAKSCIEIYFASPDPNNLPPCNCLTIEGDSDDDGVCDSEDQCEGFNDMLDQDLDGFPDACDKCPEDPLNDSNANGLCDNLECLQKGFEQFDYAVNQELNGNNGGIGFKEAWMVDQLNGSIDIASGSLNYNNNPQEGNRLIIKLLDEESSIACERPLENSFSRGSKVWISCLMKITQIQNGGVWIRPNGMQNIAIGKAWGTKFSIDNNNSQIDVIQDSVYRLVARYDLRNDETVVDLWINENEDFTQQNVAATKTVDPINEISSINISIERWGNSEVELDNLKISCNGNPIEQDLDGDGFYSDIDCDDSNADINPIAMEIANNGIDEDCDGMDLISSSTNNSNKENQIIIYPNPVRDIIHTSSAHKIVKTTILSMSGQLIQSFEKLPSRINVSHLSSGIYLVLCVDDKGKSLVNKVAIR